MTSFSWPMLRLQAAGLTLIVLVLAAPAAALPSPQADETAAPAPKTPPAAAIPHGKLVYKSDFGKGVGPEWWPRWTERTPKGDRPFLGQFGIEPVTFLLRNLPPHRYVRLHASLFMLEPSDGSSDYWGPDPWELRVVGGPQLIYATFDNCCFFTNNNEQSFPDNFPWAIQDGWTGASESETLGFPYFGSKRDCSSVYDLTLVLPHEEKDLRLLWRALWSERVKKDGESWGLERLEVEVLDGPQPLTDEQLTGLWADLQGDDSPAAFAALWTMVSGGPKTVAFIADHWVKPAAKQAEPIDETGQLLKDMDDQSYAVREQATKRLRAIGRPHLAELKKIVETVGSPEVRVRLRWVIEQLENDERQAVAKRVTSHDSLRHDLGPARTARVLETIGGEAALKVLEKAAGTKDWPPVAVASAARLRLAERMLDELLARAEATDIAGDTFAADDMGRQAADFAKLHLSEDQRRVAAAAEGAELRRKVRAAAVWEADVPGKHEAVRRRLAVGDDPAGAAQLAGQLLDDAKLVQSLRLAGQAPEDLKPEEVQAVRAFYIEEAKAAVKDAKSADSHVAARLVARAVAAARPDSKPSEERFDPAEGVSRELLAAYVADQANRGRWTDILNLLGLPVNPKTFNFFPQGSWNREYHGAIAGSNPPMLVLPVQPEGSYQLRVLFEPNGVDTLALWLPVGGGHVLVDVFSNGGEASIWPSSAATAGKAADGAKTQWSPPELTRAGEYLADVTVLQEAGGTVLVRLDVDGRTRVQWRGRMSDIKPQDDEPPAGQPAVRFVGYRMLLRTVSIRMLDGTLKVTPAEKLAPAVQPEVELPGGFDPQDDPLVP